MSSVVLIHGRHKIKDSDSHLSLCALSRLPAVEISSHFVEKVETIACESV